MRDRIARGMMDLRAREAGCALPWLFGLPILKVSLVPRGSLFSRFPYSRVFPLYSRKYSRSITSAVVLSGCLRVYFVAERHKREEVA